jgi:hypothetical protein
MTDDPLRHIPWERWPPDDPAEAKRVALQSMYATRRTPAPAPAPVPRSRRSQTATKPAKVTPKLTPAGRRYAEAEERWQRSPARAALLRRNTRAGTRNSGRDVLDLAKARRVRREHRGPPSS